MGPIIGGGGAKVAMGTADNAASTPVIDRQVVQAESSESSSGHSDKDWIR